MLLSPCLRLEKSLKKIYIYCDANVFALTCEARSFFSRDLKFLVQRDDHWWQTNVIVYHFLWIFPNNAFLFTLHFPNKLSLFGKCMENEFLFVISYSLIPEFCDCERTKFVLRMQAQKHLHRNNFFNVK